MGVAQETKLKVPRARLPTLSRKSSVKMPLGSKSESPFAENSSRCGWVPNLKVYPQRAMLNCLWVRNLNAHPHRAVLNLNVHTHNAMLNLNVHSHSAVLNLKVQVHSAVLNL